MKSKETELVLVLSFGVDLRYLSGRRYLASIPFATISFRYCVLGRRQIANSVRERAPGNIFWLLCRSGGSA
jgi:hypothetical protein